MRKKTGLHVIPILLAGIIALFPLYYIGVFISDSLKASLAISDNSRLTDFMYSFGDNGNIFSNSEKFLWKYSDESQPIRKPFGRMALLLSGDLPSDAGSKILYITMQATEANIYLDGKLADSDIKISPLTKLMTITTDISQRYAGKKFTVKARTGNLLHFEAYITDKIHMNNYDDIIRYTVMPVLLTLLLFGLLVFLISMVMAVKYKKTARIAGAGILIISTSLVLFASTNGDVFSLKQNVLHMIFFDNYAEYLMPSLLSFLSVMLLISFTFASYRRSLTSILTFFCLILISAMMYIQDTEYFRIISFLGFASAVLLLSIFALQNYRKAPDESTSGKSLLAFMFILSEIALLADLAGTIFGLSKSGTGLFPVPMVVYAITDIVNSINYALHVNVRSDERRNQIGNNRLWIERIFEESSSIFAQRDSEKFCLHAAFGIRNLISADIKENADLEEVYSRSGGFTPSIMVLIKSSENGEFVEIFKNDSSMKLDIQKILSIENDGGRRGVFFGTTYMILTFFNKEELAAVIYFENLKTGVTDNLKNIIQIAYSNFSVALDNIYLKEDIVQTKESVFTFLAEMSESKSEETGLHIRRVSEYVKILCEADCMGSEEAKIVSIGAMLHDIGKLAIPEELLAKKGRFSESEYEIVKQHVRFGSNMLQKSEAEFMKAGAIMASQHHEHWDGEGYLSLKGEEIHRYARIVTLADVFDALTTDRAYKKAWSSDDAVRYIIENSGKQFDPHYVALFIENIAKFNEIKEKYAD